MRGCCVVCVCVCVLVADLPFASLLLVLLCRKKKGDLYVALMPKYTRDQRSDGKEEEGGLREKDHSGQSEIWTENTNGGEKSSDTRESRQRERRGAIIYLI